MKPGLYVATVRGTTGLHVWNDGSGDGALEFLIIEGPYVGQWEGNDGVTDARPLVVLDPESDEDVARLISAWHDAEGPSVADEFRRVLRALAAPTPAEPMGLGAVVRDRAHRIWIRADNNPGSFPWVCPGRGVEGWSALDIAEVLSEGWTP